jgi:hypothetical protein
VENPNRRAMKTRLTLAAVALATAACGASSTTISGVDLNGTWTGVIAAKASRPANSVTMTLRESKGGTFQGVASFTPSAGAGTVYGDVTALPTGGDTLTILIGGSLVAPSLDFNGHVTGAIMRGTISGNGTAFSADSLVLRRQ